MAPKAKAPVPIPKKSRPPPKGIPRPNSAPVAVAKGPAGSDTDESSDSNDEGAKQCSTTAQSGQASGPLAKGSSAKSSEQLSTIQGLFVGPTLKQLLALSKEIFSYLTKSSSHYCVLLSKSRLRNVLQRVSQNWMLLRRYRWAPDHLVRSRKSPIPLSPHPTDSSTAGPRDSLQSSAESSTLSDIHKSLHAISEAMELFDVVLKDCYDHVLEGCDLRLAVETLLQSADRFETSNSLWSILNAHLQALQEDLAVKELVKRHILLAVAGYSDPAHQSGPASLDSSLNLLCLDDSIQSTLDGDLLRNYTHLIITGANYSPFIARDLDRINEVIVLLSSQ